jgi:hypothetical protein
MIQRDYLNGYINEVKNYKWIEQCKRKEGEKLSQGLELRKQLTLVQYCKHTSYMRQDVKCKDN